MKRSFLFAFVVVLGMLYLIHPVRLSAQQHFRIHVGSASASPGQIVNFPVILSNPAGAIAAGVTDVTIVMHFNGTTLAPTDPAHPGSIVAGVRRLFLALAVTSATDSVLTQLQMEVALGQTPITLMQIDTAYTNTPNAVLDKQNGTFSLLGLCDEGGLRLLNPNGTASVNLSQNFTDGTSLAATVTTCEDGVTKLYLVDMIGRQAKIFLDDAVPTGSHPMNLDFSGVAGGKYLLVFETPTRRETQALEVVR
ncbi:MAG TPA: hypothetical protein VEW28_10520 [Candidatus Kapabacteria bacterium]|nr:hypothetical protein [Candidatus Kapabacteria bacterium]